MTNICPCCGYCPTCGRRNAGWQQMPMPYWQQWPIWTNSPWPWQHPQVWTTTAGGVSNGDGLTNSHVMYG